MPAIKHRVQRITASTAAMRQHVVRNIAGAEKDRSAKEIGSRGILIIEWMYKCKQEMFYEI
ncbi:hypothetical protein QA601_17890 [Chitinispirillales bacterium ANBcel5]|uniref:hypothetical protein n=1 Tax=Cellulosispirillum alkaliphilum TaxID=3039283 RepID=UPI002A4FCE15|nr:hypothetical protein [Chitinispirillales bacterium ANBcel5]